MLASDSGVSLTYIRIRQGFMGMFEIFGKGSLFSCRVFWYCGGVYKDLRLSLVGIRDLEDVKCGAGGSWRIFRYCGGLWLTGLFGVGKFQILIFRWRLRQKTGLRCAGGLGMLVML